MMANSKRTQFAKRKDEVDRYIQKNYEKVIYESIAANSGYVCKQAIAEFLWALSMNGYGAKRLNDFFEFYLTVANMPSKVLGRQVNADDVIDTVQKKFGIDFNRININYQSYEDFCKEREANAKT